MSFPVTAWGRWFFYCSLLFLLACNPGEDKKTKLKADQRLYPPRAGRIQRIEGTVTKIGEDVKSIWIKIDKSKDYTTLAKSLSKSNRQDKKRTLRVSLEYVTPMGSVTRGRSFRKKWKRRIRQRLENQLNGQEVIIDLKFQEKARKFWGTVYQTIQTKKGRRIRNINLWMVYEGLSYYIIDRGQSNQDPEFVNAQILAKQRKAGLWKYQ
ncbi:MAG: hypothetical protein COB67_12330 [SAR324 cluster bacterium]|uniref:TNase-like domain-containing protein n=1 Tax=SAR324 cluster bacterium TaxID=2024889 RepID=A0A2A4SRC7_9DELT|nr:MAG: hypothetical protein COB67_12330 [SAR324 cluster bacterium]